MDFESVTKLCTRKLSAARQITKKLATLEPVQNFKASVEGLLIICSESNHLHACQLGNCMEVTAMEVFLVGFFGELTPPFQRQAVRNHSQARRQDCRCHRLHSNIFGFGCRVPRRSDL